MHRASVMNICELNKPSPQLYRGRGSSPNSQIRGPETWRRELGFEVEPVRLENQYLSSYALPLPPQGLFQFIPPTCFQSLILLVFLWVKTEQGVNLATLLSPVHHRVVLWQPHHHMASVISELTRCLWFRLRSFQKARPQPDCQGLPSERFYINHRIRARFRSYIEANVKQQRGREHTRTGHLLCTSLVMGIN